MWYVIALIAGIALGAAIVSGGAFREQFPERAKRTVVLDPAERAAIEAASRRGVEALHERIARLEAQAVTTDQRHANIEERMAAIEEDMDDALTILRRWPSSSTFPRP